MNLSILESMWRQIPISLESSRKINVLRFPSDCIPQLFLGLDAEGKRCLLLMDDSSFDAPADGHENLSLSYLRDANSGYISIRLDNDYFTDLFDDFVLSVFNQVCIREFNSELSKEFISIFLRWCEFFESLAPQDLSFEALQGLIGELTYLGSLLRDTQPASVNDVLRSWVGPFHTRTDFSLPNKHVEVKTIPNSSKQVKISSEYQLEEEHGLGIELAVLFLEKDLVNGLSLREKVEELRDVTFQLQGDFSIILHGLKILGISHSNIANYDNIRFRHLSTSTYDAALDGFPKLVRSSIPGSIKSVKYTLKLHELSDYLTPKDC